MEWFDYYVCVTLIILFIFIGTIKNETNYEIYYECKTLDNEIIKCQEINEYRTNLKGKTEDGRWVVLKEYKRITRKK